MIKAIGPGGSSQKLTIPWVVQVLQGGLEVNATITHYCSLQSNPARNFSVVNKFKLPLAITNVTLSPHVKSLFTVSECFLALIASIYSLHLSSICRCLMFFADKKFYSKSNKAGAKDQYIFVTTHQR